MFKINNKNIKDVTISLEFGHSCMIRNGIEMCKNSPKIYICGTNENDKNLSFMIEAFISDYELKALNNNEEINLKEYITDVIYCIDGIVAFPNIEDITSKVKKISKNKFNIKTIHPGIYLEYDIEIIL